MKSTRICLACGNAYVPLLHVPHQRYCCSNACQRARRRDWQNNRLRNDSDYRDNQARAQAKWRAGHSSYWREYRAAHPACHRDVFLVLEMLRDKFALFGDATRQLGEIWDDFSLESDTRTQQSRTCLLLQVCESVSVAARYSLKGRASANDIQRAKRATLVTR